MATTLAIIWPIWNINLVHNCLTHSRVQSSRHRYKFLTYGAQYRLWLNTSAIYAFIILADSLTLIYENILFPVWQDIHPDEAGNPACEIEWAVTIIFFITLFSVYLCVFAIFHSYIRPVWKHVETMAREEIKKEESGIEAVIRCRHTITAMTKRAKPCISRYRYPVLDLALSVSCAVLHIVWPDIEPEPKTSILLWGVCMIPRWLCIVNAPFHLLMVQFKGNYLLAQVIPVTNFSPLPDGGTEAIYMVLGTGFINSAIVSYNLPRLFWYVSIPTWDELPQYEPGDIINELDYVGYSICSFLVFVSFVGSAYVVWPPFGQMYRACGEYKYLLKQLNNNAFGDDPSSKSGSRVKYSNRRAPGWTGSNPKA